MEPSSALVQPEQQQAVPPPAVDLDAGEATLPDSPETSQRPGRSHRHSVITMGLSKFVRRVTKTLGFGLDIGGTLLKFVCFEPVDAYKLMKQEEADAVRLRVHRFLDAAIHFSKWEGADHLKYQCEALGGIFHFLKMPSTSMHGFVDLISDFEEVLQVQNCSAASSEAGDTENSGANAGAVIGGVSIVGVTGGGSRSFATIFEQRHLASLIKDRASAPVADGVALLERPTATHRPRLKSGQSQSHGSTTLVKYDEMACLVQGVNFLVGNVLNECYVWKNVREPGPILAAARRTCMGDSGVSQKDDVQQQGVEDETKQGEGDAYDASDVPVKHSLKLSESPTAPYPYILVNVGSGVSILRVDGENEHVRIGGSSIGGGTFLGLCRLFTGAQSFEEAIKLAIRGRSTNVDMLVSDIYGGDYDEFGLSGETIASSFGKFGRVYHAHSCSGAPGAPDDQSASSSLGDAVDSGSEAPESKAGLHLLHSRIPRGYLDGTNDPPKTANPEDMAASALLMVTINICSLVVLHAQVHNIDTVLFAGNFLAGNPVSQQLLTWALDFWSQHTMSAIFLEHEGYFGAIGALMTSISDQKRQQENGDAEATRPAASDEEE